MTVLTLTSDYIFNHMNSESGGHLHTTEKMSIGTTPRRSSSSSSSNGGGGIGCAGAGASKSSSSKRPGKRPGRKPSKIDEHAKLERSRQSARECRARKKLRYQYLEELVLNREKAVFALRDELETFKQWCMQMDGCGQVPEPLIKMIATEELKANQRRIHQQQQQKQHQQHLQQQQQQQLQQMHPLHLQMGGYNKIRGAAAPSHGSSSSSSSAGSPPDSYQRQQQLLQHQQQQQQQHQRQQQQHSPLPLNITTTSQLTNLSSSSSVMRQSPVLQRQNAIDLSSSQSHQTMVLPVSAPQHQQLQQQPHRGASQPHSSSKTFPMLSPPTTSSAFPSNNTLPGPAAPLPPPPPPAPTLARVRSEPPLRYDHPSMDVMMTSPPGVFPGATSPEGGNDIKPDMMTMMMGPGGPARGRSFSNPAAAANYGGLFQTAMISPPLHLQQQQPAMTTSSQSVGMFSGNTLSQPMSRLNLPSTVEESCSSSDDNESPANPPQLFQSASSSITYTPKRALSDPSIQYLTRLNNQSSSMSSSSSMNFDPHAALSKLTNVTCYSATRTSNTPSPSPYTRGGIDSLGSSPAPSTPYRNVTTPSSLSTTPFTTPSHSPAPSSISPAPSSISYSPAPLISLDTFLDRTTGASLPGVDVSAMEDGSVDADLGVPNFLLSGARQDSGAILNSSSGLNASISDTIPELYSFLADLQEQNQTTLAASGSSTAVTTGQGFPVTLSSMITSDPDTSLNLPTILDEILDQQQQQ